MKKEGMNKPKEKKRCIMEEERKDCRKKEMK